MCDAGPVRGTASRPVRDLVHGLVPMSIRGFPGDENRLQRHRSAHHGHYPPTLAQEGSTLRWSSSARPVRSPSPAAPASRKVQKTQPRPRSTLPCSCDGEPDWAMRVTELLLQREGSYQGNLAAAATAGCSTCGGRQRPLAAAPRLARPLLACAGSRSWSPSCEPDIVAVRGCRARPATCAAAARRIARRAAPRRVTIGVV